MADIILSAAIVALTCSGVYAGLFEALCWWAFVP